MKQGSDEPHSPAKPSSCRSCRPERPCRLSSHRQASHKPANGHPRSQSAPLVTSRTRTSSDQPVKGKKPTIGKGEGNGPCSILGSSTLAIPKGESLIKRGKAEEGGKEEEEGRARWESKPNKGVLARSSWRKMKLSAGIP
jgi:hypothetical protein